METRGTKRSREIGAVVLALFSIALGQPALAEGEPEAAEPRVLLSADLVRADAEATTDDARWFGPNFHIDGNWGLAYTRKLNIGRRHLKFSILGPVVAGKGAGLGFKLRF